MRMSIITQLMRIELVVSVVQEHESRMDHIASAPATPSMIQVGVTLIEDKRQNASIIFIVCTENDIKTNLVLFFCR